MPMAKKRKKGKPLTAADKEAARRLKQLRLKSGKSQPQVAAAYNREGAGEDTVSQGYISQLENAVTRIGPMATLKLARIFEVSPTDIRPDFAYTDLVPGELPPDVLKIAAEIAMFDKTVRDDIAETVSLLRTHGRSYQHILRKFQSSVSLD